MNISLTLYNSCLISWANQVYNQGGPLNQIVKYNTNEEYDDTDLGGSPFNNAVDARAFLVKPVEEGGAGWTITGDALV